MSLATMVYSLLRLRFAPRTELAQKITPVILFPSAYSKNKKNPGTGRGAGCCIEGGYTPPWVDAYRHTWRGIIARRSSKRPNARKTMKLLPESNRPVKYYDTTPRLRCIRFSICPCNVSRRRHAISPPLFAVKNVYIASF